MAFLESPFESISEGGSVTMAVLNGRIEIPKGQLYSDHVMQLIYGMLEMKKEKRLSAFQVEKKILEWLGKTETLNNNNNNNKDNINNNSTQHGEIIIDINENRNNNNIDNNIKSEQNNPNKEELWEQKKKKMKKNGANK